MVSTYWGGALYFGSNVHTVLDARVSHGAQGQQKIHASNEWRLGTISELVMRQVMTSVRSGRFESIRGTYASSPRANECIARVEVCGIRPDR